MNLQSLKETWIDTPEYHQKIHESFIDNVNADEVLKSSRDFVEQNVFGFGERSFWWLWKLICDELPPNANLLEIGVFRAATLSLWKLLKPKANIYGITPLDSSGGVWESDYAADIELIHKKFDLETPTIFKGRSDNDNIIKAASGLLYDVVYIDGDHSYGGCYGDLINYASLVKHGGYLVIDDCNTEMSMPFGFFQGIEDVYKAKAEWWLKNKDQWEFICSVVHISVYKRI